MQTTLIIGFYGFLVGLIMRDCKNRFGVEVFWIGMAIVTLLSLGALIVYT